jgi:ABC-type multidrug transport system permease subunit
MDTIVQVEQRKVENVLIEHWKNHGNAEHHVDPEASRFQQPKHRLSTLRELNAIPKFNTSFWTQLRLLTGRTLKQQRGERLTRVAAILTVAYTMFTSLFWFRLPDDTSSIYQRNSLLFFLLIALSNGVIMGGMTVFQQERALLERERAKKLYGVLPYFLAKTASDMSTTVLLPCLNASVVYWVANLRPTGKAFVQFVLAFYLTLSTAQSMGLFISISIPNMAIALLIAPAVSIFFMIMGGFYVPLQSMTPVVRWVSWLSFARYGYSSFVINEFQGRDIACAEDVVITIGAPGECPLSGDEVLAAMGIEGTSANFWFNVGIMLLLQLVLRVAAYALLRRHKK